MVHSKFDCFQPAIVVLPAIIILNDISQWWFPLTQYVFMEALSSVNLTRSFIYLLGAAVVVIRLRLWFLSRNLSLCFLFFCFSFFDKLEKIIILFEILKQIHLFYANNKLPHFCLYVRQEETLMDIFKSLFLFLFAPGFVRKQQFLA